MVNQTCCFTGHRNLTESKIPMLKKKLREEVINLINQRVVYFEAGGALGFDTLAVQTVLGLKMDFAQIKLILIIPCGNQSERWSLENKQIYEDIKNKADKVVYMSKKHEKGCMLKRNRHMVENSRFVVAAWDGRKKGGTYYTINYAERLNRKVILLDL